jgi:hypothetical protein
LKRNRIYYREKNKLILLVIKSKRLWDSAVGIETGYGLDD